MPRTRTNLKLGIVPTAASEPLTKNQSRRCIPKIMEPGVRVRSMTSCSPLGLRLGGLRTIFRSHSHGERSAGGGRRKRIHIRTLAALSPEADIAANICLGAFRQRQLNRTRLTSATGTPEPLLDRWHWVVRPVAFDQGFMVQPDQIRSQYRRRWCPSSF